jgi:hypothetical protein
MPTTPPLQFHGLENAAENTSPHGNVLIHHLRNPLNQLDITTHNQVTDERTSKRPRLTPQLTADL